MVTRIRSVDPLQYAFVLGVLEALLGLVIGVIFWLTFATTARSIPNAGASGLGFMMAAGPLLIVMAPIFYGILGFIVGLIVAVIYNIVAKWTGGIQMTLEVRQTAGVATGTTITTT